MTHPIDTTTQTFSEKEILNELDFAFRGEPGVHFPNGIAGAIKYNFFLDLEHGYCVTVGSRIHLYTDSSRWAIVFEKNGYQNRKKCIDITLDYVGNCISHVIEKHAEHIYISNTEYITLISTIELDRIKNKLGKGLETFELIGKEIAEIRVRDRSIAFESDRRKYHELGIQLRDYDNPDELIGFGDLARYLNEAHPEVMMATEEDLRAHIPKDLPKLMTIDKFHYHSVFDELPPSAQETFQLIAKIIVTGDTFNWQPTEKPNNHWSNWESGNL